ncbi:LuxR C-terminal-related transcriptional regulator [Streptomyces aidingensis]|uniref:Regulatory protein, luxR family n=1 Tax=Streptomyces aidingensis TaxID=910347 RepID=A0A1I1N317_9ACTN|nr:LuxR C-terminal-related transcriptional regulator [Streptomyces aidingensis]SFC92019.1 regulatory protein, luxR family [Streptomyces aidingensis]
MRTAEPLTTSPHLIAARQAALVHHHVWDAALTRVPLLSERELDVFRTLAKGSSNRAIATQLFITERTAKAHVAQILAKLVVESRLQAGIVGFAWEILTHGAAVPCATDPTRCHPLRLRTPSPGY